MVKADRFLAVCQKCKAKCCRMGGPTLTKEEKDRIIKADYPDRFFPVKGGFYEIDHRMGRCAYLKKDDACEIQPLKPTLCRCWPVFPEYRGKVRGFVMYSCPIAEILTGRQIAICKKEAASVSRELMSVALDYSTLPTSEARLLEKRFKKFKSRRLD